MLRRTDSIFHVSWRVQVVGIVSLLAVPATLAVLAWALVLVSPWLAVGVAAAFVVGAQVALARRWSSARPKPVSAADGPEIHVLLDRLCVAGGLVKPQVVVHEERYANSWIRGLTSKRSTSSSDLTSARAARTASA